MKRRFVVAAIGLVFVSLALTLWHRFEHQSVVVADSMLSFDVSGTVNDDQGRPLAGVDVYVGDLQSQGIQMVLAGHTDIAGNIHAKCRYLDSRTYTRLQLLLKKLSSSNLSPAIVLVSDEYDCHIILFDKRQNMVSPVSLRFNTALLAKRKIAP